MASWSFNPFTGNLDLAGSSGAVVFEGEVATFADLPVTIGDPAVGAAYLVRDSTGVWLVNRRQAGIYIRRNNTGVAATDWEYGGDYPVTSVNNQSGNVVLGKSDVGLGNVDNTSDANKPVSTATQTALNGKANTSHTHAAADITSGTFDNARINFAAPAAIGSTTPAAGTFTTLTANNGTLTASAPVLDLAQTWNASGTTFSGVLLNITDTASASASVFCRLQRSGTTIFEIVKGPSGVENAPSILVGGTGFGNIIRTRTGGFVGLNFSHAIVVDQGQAFAFNSTTNATTGGDLFLRRDAAGVLAQYNGTNPQAYNIYNTYTSSTNHERGFLRWSSNVFQIGTEAGSGGGTARDLVLSHGGTTRLTINDKLRTGSTAIVIGSGTNIEWGGGTIGIQASTSATPNYFKIFTASTDRLIIDPNGLLCVGGTTASFPALKRSSTVLQARLANDSDFAPLQGQLRTHANAVTETITADKTLTLYDAAGTAYKVPCVAA